ncbi:MAG: hypothetical protein WBV26_05385 [Candidatus Sulfotelmatobacter sp.]
MASKTLPQPVSEQRVPMQEKEAFQRETWNQIEQSRKQLLSRRRERLVYPPSASVRLPAAVKRAI